MKGILVFFAAIVLLVGSAQGHNGLAAIAVPMGEIVVDGDLGDWPEDQASYPLTMHVEGDTLSGPEDWAGSFKVGYDIERNMIYVAVEASDDSVVPTALGDKSSFNTQDSCELYFEVRHSKDDVDLVQYWMRGGEVGVSEGIDPHKSVEGYTAAVEWSEQGWVFEWLVDLNKAGQGEILLTPGLVVGFDVEVWDIDGDGTATHMGWGNGTAKVRYSDRLGDLLVTNPGWDLDEVLDRIGSAYLVSQEAVAHRVWVDTTENALIVAAMAMLALVHLFLYGFYPAQRENLYFAVFVIGLGWLLKPYDLELGAWGLRLSILAFLTLTFFGLRFLYEIFYPQIPKQFKIIVLGIVLWGGISLIEESVGRVRIVLMVVVFFELMRVAVQGVRKKRSGAWIIAGGFIAMMLPYVVIMPIVMLMALEVIPAKTMDQYIDFESIIRIFYFIMNKPWGALGLVLSMSIYLARNVALTNRDLAAQLAQVESLSQQAVADERQRVLLEADNARQSQELEEARTLQLSMLPQAVPELPHCEIAWQMETATEVGGDYYDYNLATDGTLTLTLGDATGHGLQSGTIVTATKSLFQSLAGHPSIVETFTVMSRSLKEMKLKRMGMAMAMVKLRGHTLQVASAGIPPLLLHRVATGQVEEVELEGMPLGLSTAFPYREREYDLAPGDTLVLMSDGLPERLNDDDEELGYPRVQALFAEAVEQTPSEICTALAQGGEEWAAGRPQDDDTTLIVVRIK